MSAPSPQESGTGTVHASYRVAPGSIRALPSPRAAGGLPLFDALRRRRSTRAYAATPLSDQQLADLLWVAAGIHRGDGGERTAPYWRHIQVIDLYAAMDDGIWRYAPERHELALHLPGDVRASAGVQDFVGVAPIELIYVAHGERMGDIDTEERRLYASVDAAFMGQNVYLYCASEGLGTVFRGAIDHARLADALRLAPGQFVTFAQTVGYPASL
jgi:nitroreductase